ncbi:MAG: hypothetical protein C0597_13000 [Marinilabiliales bacterium]|nr:MAG: hypothetical protein C0597_13000 [Marinilabiliales bacterium]
MISIKNFIGFFKKTPHKEIQLVNLFLTLVIILVSFMFIIVMYFWIQREHANLKTEISNIQQNYIESQKESIKTETERAIKYINFNIQKTDVNIKTALKSRVDWAYNVAISIYNKNKASKSKNEIKKLIIDALHDIRLGNSNSYYVIGDFHGNIELLSGLPKYEGKNLYNFQDNLGNYVIRDLITVVKTEKEGFVTNYWKRTDNDTSLGSKKLFYVKLIEPLDWYVGTDEFYEDYTKSVQQEVLSWLSNYRFGDEGYIFINTYDGDALLMNGELVKEKMNAWELEDANGVKVIQEERKAVKNPNGDYIYYSWKKLTNSVVSRKISFVKGVPEWEWMVGAGLYIDDINEVVNSKKEALKKAIYKDILFIAIWLSILFILIYLFAFYLSKRAQKTIQSFIRFFNLASTETIHIDESSIQFTEFKAIASSANKMISEIKESQKRNQEEEAHFEKLFEKSPEAIAFLNANGEIQKVNSTFTKLFGYKNREIINKTLDNLIVPPELKNEANLINKSFLEGSTNLIEAIRTTKKKEKVYVSIIGSPVTVNNTLLGYYVIYRNISDQKEFENQLYTSKVKAEESDRLKTSFLTNLSHEIRTPLNAIIGFSTLLNTKEFSKEDQKEYLRLLANSGNLLLEIIDNIIDISKFESSTLIINKTKTNLNTMLDELLMDYVEFKNNMKLSNIELDLHKELLDKEIHILTDQKRLKQIYSNLLDNALKFTEKGKVEFGYTVENNQLVCYVSDTGIGIDENEQEFIFNHFRQVDESTTRKYGGTGIGLALCKRLIELLGGKIWVESKKGKGSKFLFSIPFDVVKPEQKMVQNKLIKEDIDWSKKKILIAEDVEANYKLLYSFLERTKAKISWAKDGYQVIQMVDQDPNYDLILMDINMPIMTGHEALEKLKEKGVDIPVVAQTAYATDDQRYEIRDLGYSDYILKPITFQALLQKISKFLD